MNPALIQLLEFVLNCADRNACFYWGMILWENRYTPFRIMPYSERLTASGLT